MSKRTSLARTILELQTTLVGTVFSCLPPRTRQTISADKTQRIIEAATACAGTIGRILEQPDPVAAIDKPLPLEKRPDVPSRKPFTGGGPTNAA